MRSLALWAPAAILVGAVVAIASQAGDDARMPGLDGAIEWLNSPPLNTKALRGKVVLVNFWTYSCINSLRELPYMKAWAAKYKDAGLVVIGVHAPEFGFERDAANVRKAVTDLNVAYPVPVDSRHSIWTNFRNEYWPADYLVDASGRIRYRHFGEGDYDKSERTIQSLLRENGAAGLDDRLVHLDAVGPEAPPSNGVRSPETYLGYARAESFASPERMASDSRRNYTAPVTPALNQWGLSGLWKVGADHAVLEFAPGKVVFRFHARDLHMVLGPRKDGAPVRFRVTLNGAAPGGDHGTDATADGAGEVREPRMYQIIRQKGFIKDMLFEIEFLDPGVEAFSFTFG